MKKLLIAIISFVLLQNSFGQKTEIGISFNSGLFSFSGQSAESTSFINYSSYTNDGYTNNPYGSESGICYGASLNIKKISKRNLFFGVDLGYEILRSKVKINSVYDNSGVVNYSFDASGQTFLNLSFININPHFGYRFLSKKISVDLISGLDFALCVNSKEKGKATITSGKEYTTLFDRKTISTDIRLKDFK